MKHKDVDQRLKLNAVETGLVFFAIFLAYLNAYNLVSTFVMSLLFGVCFLGMFIYMIWSRQRIRNFQGVLFLALLGAICLVLFQDGNILMILFLAILASLKERKSFVRVFLVSSIIMFLITIMLSTNDFILTNNISTDVVNGKIVNVNNLGFRHVNQVFIFAFPILLCVYYLFPKKIILTVLAITGAYGLLIATGNRTGFIVIVLFEALTWICSKRNISNMVIKSLPYCVPALTIASIAVAFYAPKEISDILTGRPELWNSAIQHGISFINYDNQLAIPIDNFYVFTITSSGMLVYAGYLYMFIYSTRRNRDKKLALMMMGLLVYGLMERHAMNYYANIAIVLMVSEAFVCAGAQRQSGILLANINQTGAKI